MYTEDDLLPISALQHLIFCERQCALIHIEKAWEENLFTAEGRVMHEHVHAENRESRGRIRIEYGMSLRSLRLGLIGKADVVEFHRQADGPWRPFPVEYKRGKAKKDNSDKVQLCAQALCLEEMLGVEVPEGALFYGKNRRRMDVVLDDTLQRFTEDAAMRLHGLIASGHTPEALYSKKCDSCSLAGMCLPKTAGKGKSVKRYLSGVVREP
jgi:CRISPR-associated exonuclease Cas4